MAKDAGGAVLDDRSWVYDGQLRVIAEVSASGALRARYLYASSGHSPDLAVRFDPDSGVVTGSYLLVHDQVGSVVRTVDLATGVAVEVVAYDPWGVATVAPVGTAVHPFGFAGGLWDRRTGLVRFGAREYDAGLGRWLARDPIGFGGGWNQYGYVGNDPTGAVDPDGLRQWEDALDPSNWGVVDPQEARDIRMVQNGAPLAGAVLGGLLLWGWEAYFAAPVIYNFTNTVCGKASSRPYVSQLAVNEIVRGAQRVVPDPQGVPNALMYYANGTLNGKPGVFEVLINQSTKTVMHLLHVPGKKP